jgi:hypothetical protein
MAPWLTWVFGVVLVTTESALLAAAGWTVGGLMSGVGTAVLVGSRRSFVTGAGIVAALLLPIEWVSGVPGGLASVGVVAVFLAVGAVRHRLPKRWGPTQVIVGTVLGALYPLTIWLAATLVMPRSNISIAILAESIPGLAGLAVFLALGGSAMSWLDSLFERAGTSSPGAWS